MSESIESTVLVAGALGRLIARLSAAYVTESASSSSRNAASAIANDHFSAKTSRRSCASMSPNTSAPVDGSLNPISNGSTIWQDTSCRCRPGRGKATPPALRLRQRPSSHTSVTGVLGEQAERPCHFHYHCHCHLPWRIRQRGRRRHIGFKHNSFFHRIT